MKYKVTAVNINRNDYKQKIFPNGNASRVEMIDTEANQLFDDCETEWEVEDMYEAFWNRLNDGYTNDAIVKVVNVEKVMLEVVWW